MIEVSGFQKTFYVGFWRKPFHAARDISFAVEPGEIFGFLGPNGAGKTTTIKALLGLIRPDKGSLKLFGEDVNGRHWRSKVGYMPEHPTFYDYLTGLEIVTWFGRLSGLSKSLAEEEARKHLDRVGLSYALNRRLRGYSKGMLQRAGLAAALMGAPELLILDEPMAGLDPIGRKDIRELILSLNADGRTIFYSTHILPDVEMTCHRVAIIHRGKSIRTGRLEDILTETTRGITVAIAALEESAVKQLRGDFAHATFSDGLLHADFPDIPAAQHFTDKSVGLGGKIVKFVPHRDDLESIFMKSLGEQEEVSR